MFAGVPWRKGVKQQWGNRKRGFRRNFWTCGAWPKDQSIRFCWRSGPRSGSMFLNRIQTDVDVMYGRWIVDCRLHDKFWSPFFDIRKSNVKVGVSLQSSKCYRPPVMKCVAAFLPVWLSVCQQYCM